MSWGYFFLTWGMGIIAGFFVGRGYEIRYKRREKIYEEVSELRQLVDQLLTKEDLK